MTWTNPLTAVDGVDLTAAQWNASVRDNLLETAPGKATGVDVASGDTLPSYFTTKAANQIAERHIYSGTVDDADTTISVSYNVPAGTAGPDISAYCGTYAMVFHGCRIGNGTTGKFGRATFELNGDGGNGGRDVLSEGVISIRASAVNLIGTNAESYNTFKMLYRSDDSGTTFLATRRMMIMPFG